MAYNNTIKSYLKRLQEYYSSAQRSGQYTDELSYRPAINDLLMGLAKDLNDSNNIDVILEPKNQGKVGRPDWRIHDKTTLGIYGFVEAKGLSETVFDIKPYYSQIAKYLSLQHKLIITDGVDFVFCFDVKEKPQVISLIDKRKMKNTKDWSKLEVDPQFQLLMSQFYADPSPQQCSEGTLIELVALRTRLLADEIINYAEIPEDEAMDEDEKNMIVLLSSIRKLIYNHNDERLKNSKVFADFTAQTIMFSLLYAHRVLCKSEDSPVEKEEKIRDFITKDLVIDETLMPFRNLMVFLRDNADACVELSQWIDECIRFLSFVQMTDTQLLHPDYHKMFEFFLSKYDARVRFDYGAYYTPSNLARFIVKLTDLVAKRIFDGASIYDAGNTIIDPCCGTGSFLEELIINDDKNEAYHLCGFEIMPTPYMLANYRMAVLKKQYGSRLNSPNVILANTLSNCVYGEGINEKTIEGKEFKRANEWVSKPLKLIIGNPPCSDTLRQNDSGDFSIINRLMEDFRPPLEMRHGRQNIQKQINNPFMQFIRWGCERLMNSEDNSILSFIVPLSFLEAESYKYARKYLCENFSAAWIIAIDADARTGVRNNSLFHTLQGRAIVLLCKKFGNDDILSVFNYIDISTESLDDKCKFLEWDDEEVIKSFEEYPIDKSSYSFAPAKPFDKELYDMFWAVSGNGEQTAIFNDHCSGIKLAPTALFTHIKEPMLKRRTKELAGGRDVVEWFSGQDKKPDQSKLNALKDALDEYGNKNNISDMLIKNVKPYAFRPFLTSNVFLWEEVLRKYATIGGGGTRLRPEIISTYSDDNTVGFAMAHAPKDLNPSLSQFVSFCWYYPDNDMCTRGNSHIYMNQYCKKGEEKPKSNINSVLIEHYCKILNCSVSECERAIIFYVYGIMCSQVYLDEFEGALFTLNRSDDRARVPFIENAEVFQEIIDIGQKLAELEKVDYKPQNVLNYNYDDIVGKVPEGFRLANSTKTSPFDEENEMLILSDGKTKITIKCPLELQKLNISGYDVVKNVWLKFHSYDFTHCEFVKEDMKQLLDFLNTLKEHSYLVAKIDPLVKRILEREFDFFTPN